MAQTSSQRTKMSPRLQRWQQVLLSKACKGGGSHVTVGNGGNGGWCGHSGAFTVEKGSADCARGSISSGRKTGAWQRGNAGNGDDPRAGVGCYQVL